MPASMASSHRSRIRDRALGALVAPRAAAALDGGVPPTPADFERMWSDLAPIGRPAASGGYFRQPFTQPERELSDWFREQAAARDLRLESDATGNLVAWWRSGTGPGVLTGSHLDSVLDGGAYDGPLGVVAALAAVDE